MARQEGDHYVATDGTKHDSMGAASLRDSTLAGVSSTMAGMGGFLQVAGGAMILIPIVGAIVVVMITILSGVRVFFEFAKSWPLFMISLILGACIGAFVFKIMRVGLIQRIFIFVLVSIIATIPFGVGSYFIYRKTSKYFPTVYYADYVVALQCGTAAKVHSKRFQKGDVLAELVEGERVTVNGLSLDYNEFNITTVNGITGWIPASALPKDNKYLETMSVDALGGFIDDGTLAMDRDTVNLMQKYLDAKVTETTLKGEPLAYKYVMNDSTLNRMIRVNAQTPYLHLSSKEYKEGGELKDTGEKVTLANILYADDCTIIYITAPFLRLNNYNLMPYGAQGNTNEWKKSLVVTDLNTGEQWRVLQADYSKTHNRINRSDATPPTETVVYFFPPFKSRNFSLTHEVLPMPDKDNVRAGYGGLIGLFSNVASGDGIGSSGAVNYNNWNFPEVRVR